MDASAAPRKHKATSPSPEPEGRVATSMSMETSDNGHKRRKTIDTDAMSPLVDPGQIGGSPCLALMVSDGEESGDDEDDSGEDDEGDELDYDEDDSGEDDEGDELDYDEDDESGNPYRIFDDDGDDYDEDNGPPEFEVQEQTITLAEPQNTKLALKLFRQEDDDEFEEWMETLIVTCSHEDKEIGRGLGRYVKRNWIRDTFWRDMEEPCQELSSIAFEIFDRYGCLKSELIDHPVRKGTGCWGSELDLGTLFIIEHVSIGREWRRKGVGKAITSALIGKARAAERSPTFILVSPGFLTRDVEAESEDKSKREQRNIRVRAYDSAVAFFRSLGFRRIGASSCFGLPTDADHKAKKLSSTDDFNLPDLEVESGLDESDDEDDWTGQKAKERRLQILQQRLPLHHATLTLPETECVEFYEKFNKSRNATEWAKMDRAGKNLLHIAAQELKTKSVQWLMANVNEDKTLSSARDREGYTPLEALEAKLENKRTIKEHGMATIVISDIFRGFDKDAIQCLLALKEIANPNMAELLRLKFGCSCGQCIDGFLSPRMKFALLCQAEITHDMLDMDVEDGVSWCMMHDYLTTHVAPDIQRNFKTNKSYRQGYANLFEHIAVALADSAPTVRNVVKAWESHSEWPPHTKNFFQRGGTVESGLRILFEHASGQDEFAGDGEHLATFEKVIDPLPKCRNDHEFGFVALACGIPELYGSKATGNNMIWALRRLTTVSGEIRPGVVSTAE